MWWRVEQKLTKRWPSAFPALKKNKKQKTKLKKKTETLTFLSVVIFSLKVSYTKNENPHI